jgi:hypothetical protein
VQVQILSWALQMAIRKGRLSFWSEAQNKARSCWFYGTIAI